MQGIKREPDDEQIPFVDSMTMEELKRATQFWTHLGEQHAPIPEDCSMKNVTDPFLCIASKSNAISRKVGGGPAAVGVKPQPTAAPPVPSLELVPFKPENQVGAACSETKDIEAAAKRVVAKAARLRAEVRRRQSGSQSSVYAAPCSRLAPGWRRLRVTRATGATTGRRDVYYVFKDPNSSRRVKLRSFCDVVRYLGEAEERDGMRAEDFDFCHTSYCNDVVVEARKSTCPTLAAPDPAAVPQLQLAPLTR